MELFLDSANLEEIRFWSERLSIDGVTTNPTLIAREGIRPGEVVPKIFEIIGQDKLVHVQVLAQDSAGMIKEAYQIRSWHEQVVVKIPLTLEGLQAIKALRASGIRTTATGIVTAPQGLLAAKVGADYVAPYVNRIESTSGDGIQVVADLVKLFQLHGLPTKVLAASFRNSRQILQVLQQEGRISNQELADRIGLSPSPCLRRVRTLEEAGLIIGYRALLAPKVLGLSLMALIHISMDRHTPERFSDFEAAVSEIPEVMECLLITGQAADYQLKVVVRDMDAYQDLLLNRITGIKGVSGVHSSFVLRRVVDKTALPVDGK